MKFDKKILLFFLALLCSAAFAFINIKLHQDSSQTTQAGATTLVAPSEVDEHLDTIYRTESVDATVAEEAIFPPENAAETNFTIRNMACFIRAYGQSVDDYLGIFTNTPEYQMIVTISEDYTEMGFPFGASRPGEEGIVGCRLHENRQVCYLSADPNQVATKAQIKVAIREMLADQD